ncbi:tetratricopeptide repeat protein [Acuticoccus sediminis]|uniref:tetratricopeptide repeat protein n=1 Tax=Acuticoccus sediminis TaxID=2184697 RepID=UPI001CFF05C9|nr:tetratricopeptide repeat protein [Acuticoccus sediminis]
MLAAAFQTAVARSDWAAAVAALDGLIALAPSASLSYNKAVALRRAGRAVEAAEAARTALAQDPAHGNALFELGAALMDAGDRPGATGAFRRVLARHPGDADARTNLAALQVAAGEPSEALAVLGDVGGAEAEQTRAAAWRDLGDLDAADRHMAALPAATALKIATQGATGRIPLDVRRWRPGQGVP